MADERNIQDFNRGVALVLGRLYTAFPVPTVLQMDDLDDTADRETRRAYAATVRFLRDEGLIRVQSETIGDGFIDVTLTAKGLRLMRALPEGVQEKAPWYAWIPELLKNGSRAGLSAAIEALIGQLGSLR